MFWKVFFYCDPTHAANLGNMLEDHVSAVSWFETKDPALWMVETIFETKPRQEEFAHLLSCACAALDIAPPSFIIEELPDTDWLEATWRSFPPRQIGRYYVYGSHTSPTPPEGSIPLQINAATAFGSGEHETTTTCLLTLDDLAKNGRLFHKPLDMGCGSGILAIAVAKTWDIPVIAADNDPESVRVTIHNSILNGCAPLLKAYVSDGFENKDVCAAGPYDLIVANILATPLIKMATSISRFLAPRGVVILSGLLTRHQEDVVKAYEIEGIRLVSHKTLNDWEALLLERK
jgi:ribosomal protein L11 methyltransferase